MTIVLKKLTKKFRWLRWSTILALVFYMFFIGLILHSTTYKLVRTLTRNGDSGGEGVGGGGSISSVHLQRASSLKGAVAGAESASEALVPLLENNDALQQPQETSRAVSSRDVEWNKLEIDGKVENLKDGENEWRKSSEPETVILAASSVNERQILEKHFKRADTNNDGALTIQELAFYINKKINDHVDEAIRLNPREFQRVDISPADGLVSWEEYHRFFLKQHGMTEADIDDHDEIKHTALNRKAREDMMRDKARYAEAARTDFISVTIDEYLSFRHPESSISNLLELVDDLLRLFDQDGDDQLTIEEFSDVSMDDDDDVYRKSLISKTVVERREEFKRIIDKNHDGKADRSELLDYVNPKTPRYALQEAATLFNLADKNKDGKLTINELVLNAEIFLTSKMIDTANSFHQDF